MTVDNTLTVRAFREGPEWDLPGKVVGNHALPIKWWELPREAIARLHIATWTVTDPNDTFDPESLRAVAESEVGGPVVLVY